MRLFLSLLLLALGLFLGLGDAFLATWRVSAGSHSDISARGPFLLVLYLPAFTAVTAVATLAASLGLGRWLVAPRLGRVLVPLIATLLVGVALYLEPTGAIWRGLLPVRMTIGPLWAGVLDLGLASLGLALLWPRPAAAAPVTAAA